MSSVRSRNRGFNGENKLIWRAPKFVILFHVHPSVHRAWSHMNKPDNLVNLPGRCMEGSRQAANLRGGKLIRRSAEIGSERVRAQGITPAGK